MIVPLAMLAALTTGVLVGEQLGGGSARLLLGIALTCFGIAYATRGTRGSVCVVIIACIAFGVAVEQRSLHGLEYSPLTGAVAADDRGEAVLTLAEDPDGPTFESGAIARVATFDGRDAGDRRVFVVVQGDERSVFAALDAGDRLRATGTIAPLHGFSTRLRWQHAVGEFRVDDIGVVARPDSPWFRLANGARRAVLRGSATLPATPRALLTGFLLGDTRGTRYGVGRWRGDSDYKVLRHGHRGCWNLRVIVRELDGDRRDRLDCDRRSGGVGYLLLRLHREGEGRRRRGSEAKCGEEGCE